MMSNIKQAEAEIDRLTPILEKLRKTKAELVAAEAKAIKRQEIEKRLEDEDRRFKELNDELKAVHKKLLARVEIESTNKREWEKT